MLSFGPGTRLWILVTQLYLETTSCFLRILEILFKQPRGNLHQNFTNLYGEEILRKSERFEKLRKKKGKLLSSPAFLQCCRDTSTLPSCVEVKHHLKTLAARKILRRTSEALLRERIHHKRLDLHCLSEELYHIHLELAATLTATDWDTIDKLSFESSRAVETTHRENQIKKYEKLQSRRGPPVPDNGPNKDRTIVNLTDMTLNESTTEVLAKGLNFAITPRDIPRETIITEVESGIRKLPKTVADEVREDVTRVLRSAKPPKSNITPKERAALKALREDGSIVVLPADKGNATVLMKKEDYNRKMEELLSDLVYHKLEKIPMAKADWETRAIIKRSYIPVEEQRRLIVSVPKPPRLYGLPKIHKEGVPLRPIVSQIDAPTYHLAQYIANTLQEYVDNTSYHIKNSAHFVEIIRDLTIKKEDIIIGFDVVSLFTNVPIADSVDIVKKLTSSGIPKNFPKLVEHCLKNTFFLWNGSFYEQTDGAVMGSPLSPVMANLFMEDFEAKAIETYQKKPKLWLRAFQPTSGQARTGPLHRAVVVMARGPQHYAGMYSLSVSELEGANVFQAGGQHTGMPPGVPSQLPSTGLPLLRDITLRKTKEPPENEDFDEVYPIHLEPQEAAVVSDEDIAGDQAGGLVGN
ncbi:uncharacterized protein LOC124171124 [Ischnura elegans]|uniref:uncharacterized protein LOC124171124 n=1 Tax=Ischnura elegans TaxID=197161 RepID=UPI001ED8B58C|nr:uncharacterized protein LOC124171124 [Ischnura elegans]